MTILCIETSTQVCSAAICRDGMCVEQRISREGGNHAKLLPVFIDELLQGANERGERIEAVALSEGPGSYTGLRIGTSTAKGLCYGLNVPLIPVPTLDVLCAAACEQLTNDLTVSPSSGETLDGRGNNSQLHLCAVAKQDGSYAINILNTGDAIRFPLQIGDYVADVALPANCVETIIIKL